MAIESKIPAPLQARVDAVALRMKRSAADVVADALEHGHSLEWQERFLDHVAEGLKQADQGVFASEAEVSRVLNRYRPT